ncbi:hypothetical protein DFJ73DRAFT_829854 [Zopfochytrium polystomum]|nr:hypothetical protein DFJ73DRAFT_829854 [Zopfochytrium polystomum]
MTSSPPPPPSSGFSSSFSRAILHSGALSSLALLLHPHAMLRLRRICSDARRAIDSLVSSFSFALAHLRAVEASSANHGDGVLARRLMPQWMLPCHAPDARPLRSLRWDRLPIAYSAALLHALWMDEFGFHLLFQWPFSEATMHNAEAEKVTEALRMAVASHDRHLRRSRSQNGFGWEEDHGWRPVVVVDATPYRWCAAVGDAALLTDLIAKVRPDEEQLKLCLESAREMASGVGQVDFAKGLSLVKQRQQQ